MKHSILRVTVTLTIVIVVLTCIAVSLPYYRFSQELLLERAMDELMGQGRMVSLTMSSALEDASHEIDFLAGDDAALDILRNKRPSTESRRILAQFLDNHPMLDSVVIYPISWPEGVAIAAWREGEHVRTRAGSSMQFPRGLTNASEDTVRRAMDRAPGELVSAAGDQRREFIQIASPIRDGKNNLGVVAIRLNLQAVLSAESQTQAYAAYVGTWTVLTDASGQPLYVRRPGGATAATEQEQVPHWATAQNIPAVTIDDGISQERIGEDEYAVYRHTIKYTEDSDNILKLYLLVPFQEITSKDDPHQLQTLSMSIASVVLAALILFFYSRRFAKPIEQIMSALSAFRKGEAVAALPTERTDELGELGRSIDNMIREVRERTVQMEESRAKLEALFEVVQEGIVITDQDGIIESVNPSLCTMFGYDEQELLGQSNVMLMPEPYSTNHDKYMRDSIRTDTLGFMGMYRDLTALRKDGSTFPVVINVETLKLGDEQLFAAIIRDVTKQKEYERDLLNAKMRAEVANEAKSNFLSMMSHEIRTPLNGVMGVLQILESEISDSEQKEFLDVASRSAANLLHIVNDILDISKAESGAMELEEQEFNLRELLEESVELYMVKLADKEIAMRFFMPMDMPECVIGDPFRLQQMVNNLLSNAIKFTAEGEIGLAVSWEPKDETSVNIRIDVFDTGVGISRDKLKTIFEPFMQADNSISRSYGGTGLGLSIVKRITTLMGGRVWVNSEPGEGSSFHLYLPFSIADIAPSRATGWLHGRRVLYAGEKHDASMLLEYLSHHKATVDIIDVDELKQYGLPDDKDYDVVIAECIDDAVIGLLNRLAGEAAEQETRFICLRQHIESHHPELHHAVVSLHEPVLNRSLDSLFS